MGIKNKIREKVNRRIKNDGWEAKDAIRAVCDACEVRVAESYSNEIISRNLVIKLNRMVGDAKLSLMEEMTDVSPKYYSSYRV